MKRLLFLGLFLVLALPLLASPAFAIESDDLFNWWPFNGNLDDVHSGVDGVNFGTTNTSGKLGDARDFDGTNDFIGVNGSQPPDHTNSHSMAVWVNPDVSGSANLVYACRATPDNNPIVWLWKHNNESVAFRLRDNSGAGLTTAWGSAIPTGSWSLVGWSYNGSSKEMSVYVDGVETGSATYSGGSYINADDCSVGRDSSNGGELFWDGKIDEPNKWNRTLTPQDWSDLYNGGSGLTYSELINGTIPSADVRVLDLYDDAALQGLNVSWANGKSNLTGADGIAHCNNCTGQSFDVFDPSGAYFNASGTAVENATTDVKVFGARYNLSAFDVHGDALSVFNVSSGLQANQTSGGSLFLVLRPNDTLTVEGSAPDFLNRSFSVSTGLQDLGSANLTGFFQTNLTVNATDSLDGSAISTFCVNVTGVNTSSFEDRACTSSGNVSFGLLREDYNLFINATGYAFQNETVTMENETQTFEFFLLPTNSLFLFFFDEFTQDSLNGTNVTVEFQGPSGSFTNSSTSGEMIAKELSTGTWNLTADAPGYDERLYFVTVGSRSSQDVDIYLANSTQSQTTTFDIRSQTTSDIIVGATLTMQHQVSGSWVTIGQCITDAFGTCRFELIDGKEYRFVVEADGFETKTGTFVRTLSSYVISISEDTETFQTYLDDFSFSASPDAGALDSDAHNFSLTVSSPDGRMEWFSQEIRYGNTTVFNNVSGSPSGGTIIREIDLSSFSGQVVAEYQMQSTSFDSPFTFSRTWTVFSNNVTHNYTFIGFMEHYGDGGAGELGSVEQALLITTGAVLLALGVGLVAGGIPAALVAALVFAAGSFFGWLHWSVSIVVIFLIMGLIFSERRGGGV